MTAETQTHTPAVLEPGEYSQFMLRSRAEIAMVLRGLQDHVAQTTVFFNEGKDMLITSVAAVATDHVILDFGPSSEMNRKALIAEKHFCVTSLDKVRVQFILRKFAQVDDRGRPAFRCNLPDEVLRLQRREFYRLITPIARPLQCKVTVPLPNGTEYSHAAHIFDISGGGMGISAPPEQIPFITGMTLPQCRIDLPEVGSVTGALQVRSLFDIVLRNGARTRRAGCEFINLPGPMMTLIQRYIIKVERERKARESGLG